MFFAELLTSSVLERVRRRGGSDLTSSAAESSSAAVSCACPVRSIRRGLPVLCAWSCGMRAWGSWCRCRGRGAWSCTSSRATSSSSAQRLQPRLCRPTTSAVSSTSRSMYIELWFGRF